MTPPRRPRGRPRGTGTGRRYERRDADLPAADWAAINRLAAVTGEAVAVELRRVVRAGLASEEIRRELGEEER